MYKSAASNKLITYLAKSKYTAPVGRLFNKAPVSGEFLDKATRAIGGNSVKESFTTELMNEHARRLNKSTSKHYRKLLNLTDPGSAISKSEMNKGIREFNVAHGTPEGNFVQRQLHNAAEDVAHPIANTKKSLMHMLYNYDPKRGLVGKSPGGIAVASAMGLGFPAWTMYDAAKEKNTSPAAKAGKMTAYGTIPFALRRFVPSMAAYGIADKAFKGRGPVPDEGY